MSTKYCKKSKENNNVKAFKKKIMSYPDIHLKKQKHMVLRMRVS